MPNLREDVKKVNNTFNQWEKVRGIKGRTHQILMNVYHRYQISTEMSLSSSSFRIYNKTQGGFVEAYIQYGEGYDHYETTMSINGEWSHHLIWSHHIRLDTDTYVAAWRIAREYIQIRE